MNWVDLIGLGNCVSNLFDNRIKRRKGLTKKKSVAKTKKIDCV